MTGTLQPTYFSQYHAQSFKALLLQKSWQLITNLYSKNGCLCVVEWTLQVWSLVTPAINPSLRNQTPSALMGEEARMLVKFVLSSHKNVTPVTMQGYSESTNAVGTHDSCPGFISWGILVVITNLERIFDCRLWANPANTDVLPVVASRGEKRR